MKPPFISYITWNRMGLTVKNLNRLLASGDDFELHIIDNNSQDDTWEFIKDLKDKRIKTREQFEVNRGVIYALNYNLSRRAEDQYFITVDNDVYIHTLDFIPRFLEVFDTFPEAGMLGVPRPAPYPEFLPPVIPRVKDGVCYLRLAKGEVEKPLDFIPASLLFFRPELFTYIGFWCEESGYRDAEISARINGYTPYRAGFVTNVHIEQNQFQECKDCCGKRWCSLDGKNSNCNFIWRDKYVHRIYAEQNQWKNKLIFEEMEKEKRSAYCRSVHSDVSIPGDIYHKDWVEENFKFYMENAN